MDTQVEGSRGGASSPSSISSTLLERIRARRPEAWQRLVDLYGPLVYRWSRQLGVNSADSADIAQEVFASVSAHLDQFRRDRPEHEFGAWLRTITRNKIRDHYRQRQVLADGEGGTHAYQQLLDLAESPEESSMGRDTGTESQKGDSPIFADTKIGTVPDTGFLRRMLDLVRVEFENRTWEAFWRLVVDGQSPAEVAAAMGLSLPAVYKAKSHVLRRLRQELKDLGE